MHLANYGYGKMDGSLGAIHFVAMALVLIDLFLLGVWLWQNIKKK